MHVDKTPTTSGRPRTRSQYDKHLWETLSAKKKESTSGGNLEKNGVVSPSLGKGRVCLNQDDDVRVENSQVGVEKLEGRMTRSMRRTRNGGGENCSGSKGVSEGEIEENGSSSKKKKLGSGADKSKNASVVECLGVEKSNYAPVVECLGVENNKNAPVVESVGVNKIKKAPVVEFLGITRVSTGDSSKKGRDLRSGDSDESANHKDDCVHLGMCSSSASDGSDQLVDSDVGMNGEEEVHKSDSDVEDSRKTDLSTWEYSGDEVECMGDDFDLSSLKSKGDFDRGSGSKMRSGDENLQDDGLAYVVPNSSDSDNSSGESDESQESTDLEALLGEESSCYDDSDDMDYKGEESLRSASSGSTFSGSNDNDDEYDSDGDGSSDIQGKKNIDMVEVQNHRNGKKGERMCGKNDRGFERLKHDDRSDECYNKKKESNNCQVREQVVINRSAKKFKEMPEKKQHGFELLNDNSHEVYKSNYRQENEQVVINIDDSEKSSERQRTVKEKPTEVVHIDDAMEEARKVLGYEFRHNSDRVGHDDENQGRNGHLEKEQSALKTDDTHDSENLFSHTKRQSGLYKKKVCPVVQEVDDMMDEARKVLGDDFNLSGSKRSRIDTEKESHDVEHIDEMMDDERLDSGNGSSRSGLKKKKLCGLSIQVEFGKSGQRRYVRHDQPDPLYKFKEAEVGKLSPSPVKGNNTSSTDDELGTSKWERHSQNKVGKSKNRSSRAARHDDLIRMLKSLDSVDDPVEESAPIHEACPLKFRFEDEVDPPPEKSEQEKEIDSLWLDMQLALRASEIDDYANLPKTANEDNAEIDNSPAACCHRGEHETERDEQIGIVCRHCREIILPIKDILPDWDTRRFGRQNRKDFDESPDSIFDDLKFQDSAYGPPGSFTRAKGTVWDLVPGVELEMFPHQREAFEFMWKNIGGDIKLDKLKRPLCDSGKGTGCIISHAPGTGKTRLTIVFLQAFFKLYPKCHPVIIAPKGVLNTWETELTKWKADLVFHNLNKQDLSSSEIEMVKQKAGINFGGMNKDDARLVKLSSWIISGGILGISYSLFGRLTGVTRSKGQAEHDEIWNKLAEKPGLLILDEGHTPRNGDSRIWKALRKVETQRRIILSGTPFQNNFDELKNTLCLVDPTFLNLDKNYWRQVTTDTADGLKKLRSMLNTFVHVHQGSVLENNLPGLRDTLVYLRPNELQGTMLEVANGISSFLKRTHLVSLVSVHPSMVLPENNELFTPYKAKLEEIESDSDAGVKLKFVMNLTYLATEYGDRVLIFSQYIQPLQFIKKHLEARYSWKEGREILYMDGQLDVKQRQESISSLNDSSSEAKVLLASEKACSEGINLIGASRVVLLDTVWNPSVERQAISRSYRYHQKKVVYVYRLIISGLALEVRQNELQAQKEQISQMIFSHGDGQASQAETSASLIEDQVLKAMTSLKSCRGIFEKIIPQNKEIDDRLGDS